MASAWVSRALTGSARVGGVGRGRAVWGGLAWTGWRWRTECYQPSGDVGRGVSWLDWVGGGLGRRWRVRCWRDVDACSGRPGGPGGGGGVRRSRLPAPAGRLRRATGTRRRNRRGSGGKAPGRTAARAGTVAAGRGFAGTGALLNRSRRSHARAAEARTTGRVGRRAVGGLNNTARLGTARRKRARRGGVGGCGGGRHVNAACDLGRRVVQTRRPRRVGGRVAEAVHTWRVV